MPNPNPTGKCLFLTNRDTKQERRCGLKVLAVLLDMKRSTNADWMYCRRHKRVVMANLRG